MVKTKPGCRLAITLVVIDLMIKTKRIFLVLLIFPIIGCLVGSAFYEWDSSTLRKEWELLGTPPSKAVEIYSTSPLVVLSSNGNYYSYIFKSNGWEIILPDKIVVEDNSPDYVCPKLEIPPIDNLINSTESCTSDGGPDYTFRKYAVLTDGSVWIWVKAQGWEGDSIGPILVPAIGSGIFLLLAVITVLIFIFDDYISSLKKKANIDDN